MTPLVPTFAEGRAAWVADLQRVAARDHWGLALIGVGFVHLAAFLGCQAMHDWGDRRGWHYLVVWGLEFLAVLLVLRKIAGRGWIRATPLAGVIARVWGTVLILSFNLASMNTLSGLGHEWFKPVLCTVAAFGFMMMAYLVHAWFFAAAVQMYFTGLIMLHYIDFSYLIHGLSWWAILLTLGGSLEWQRRRARARPQIVPIRVLVPEQKVPSRRPTFRARRPS